MQRARFRSPHQIALLVLAAAACQRGANTVQAGAITVQPSAVTLDAGATQSFAVAAASAAASAVAWSVLEGPTGGSVTSAGAYTAPQSAGTFHVVATSVVDPTLAGSATVTVVPPSIAVAVTPSTASLSGCKSATFTATVTNTSSTAVTWSVQEGAAGGTISSSGAYVAPATPGTYHVVATSQADETKSAVATITVSTQVLGVSVSPATTSLQTGGAATFTATVTTTCGQFTATQAVALGGALP